MPIYTGHTWAWKTPEGSYTNQPAGTYPGPGLGWVRVDMEDQPSENNTWDYGPNNKVDAMVWPEDMTNVEKNHVNDKIITTKMARAGLYAMAKSRWTRSVNYIHKVDIGLIGLFGYNFKWPVAMEE